MEYNKGILPALDIVKVSREISSFIENSLIESKTQGLVMGLSGVWIHSNRQTLHRSGKHSQNFRPDNAQP